MIADLPHVVTPAGKSFEDCDIAISVFLKIPILMTGPLDAIGFLGFRLSAGFHPIYAASHPQRRQPVGWGDGGTPTYGLRVIVQTLVVFAIHGI